jgi:hypothetical protein
MVSLARRRSACLSQLLHRLESHLNLICLCVYQGGPISSAGPILPAHGCRMQPSQRPAVAVAALRRVSHPINMPIAHTRIHCSSRMHGKTSAHRSCLFALFSSPSRTRLLIACIKNGLHTGASCLPYMYAAHRTLYSPIAFEVDAPRGASPVFTPRSLLSLYAPSRGPPLRTTSLLGREILISQERIFLGTSVDAVFGPATIPSPLTQI